MDMFHARSRRSRDRCVQDRNWYTSSKVKQRMRENDQRDLTHVDPSLLSLWTIGSISLTMDRSKVRATVRKSQRSRYGGVLLPRAMEVPHYDAWIPVLVNYWVGKELHVEPYMPFLGDQDNECEAAFEVYVDMAGDLGKEVELSDGELNDAGKFVAPRKEGERIKYYSMAMTRWREATRRAILAVLDQYDKPDENMWRVLAQTLGMKTVARVKAVARVAEDRRKEMEETIQRRKLDKNIRNEMRELWSCPVEEVLLPEDELGASPNVLKHFCFTCHTIPCAQHAGMDVEPVLPIDDLPAREREKKIATKTAEKCSSSCGLRRGKFSMDFTIDLISDSEWTAEEILLLRDAVSIFGMDPCSLAIVIGSRTCSEVATKLDDPIEADILEHEIRKAQAPRRRLGERKKRGEGLMKEDKSKSINKTIVEIDGATATDQDFEPCEHIGPCTLESCSCVKKGTYCETTCGCNFGRYGEGGETGGIVWLPPSDEAVEEKRAIGCENRHYGCSCQSGHCTAGSCPCWENYRACSPDWCECDVSCLPGHVSIEKRQCRNWPITVGRHKRTFIGKSEVHGFGLFAGARFEEGDLVGVYSGQVIDTRLADMIGRIYDATNRTYIFNVTETLVIDGGLLGSKAKFCNHTKPGSKENCVSRLVRIRGDAYVALFCKRPVNIGEEFLFDYRFTGEVPAWARDDRGKLKK